MTPTVAHLIATPVTAENAAEVEERCQAELCLAHAAGDQADYLALQGKLQRAREARFGSVAYGESGPALDEVLRLLGLRVEG
jgi:hypothetical protein